MVFVLGPGSWRLLCFALLCSDVCYFRATPPLPSLQIPDEQWLAIKSNPLFVTALKKARSKGLFLGLDESWLTTPEDE